MIRYCEDYWNDVDRALACIPNPEKLDGRSVLITGATGMICSSLADLLLRLNSRRDCAGRSERTDGVGGSGDSAAGIRIILAGRSEERIRARFAGFTGGRDYFFLRYDATETDDVKQPDYSADYIIHGASNADPAVLSAEPVETILANVAGLNRMLSAACAGGSRRLLYISSSEVYGNRTAAEDELPYSEEDYGYVDLLNPRSSYPCSKRTAETLCVSYGQEHGLDTVIVRPGHIYGPQITERDSRASAQFTRNAAAGDDIVMKSAGTQLRSYCYTLDCASAILAVLLNGENGNAYNISNRDSIVTIRDVAEALAKAGGTRVVFEEATEREKAGYNLMTNSSLNARKLEGLGWKAVFGLEEGAEKTLAFYRQG